MKHRTSFFSTAAILLVLFSALALPAPVWAAAPDITGVSPASVPGGVATEVTITGIDFEVDYVAVTLQPGAIPLPIQSWSTTTLVVIVPASVPAGTYSIHVTNNTPPPGTPGTAVFSPFTVSAAAPYGRPQLAVKNYRTNVGEIRYGQDFNLVVRMENAGQYPAYNVQAVFTSSDLAPLKTGGVAVVGDVAASASFDVGQHMTASAPFYGKASVIVEMVVTYYDNQGTQYSEKFTLNVPVVASSYVAANTATPTGVAHSQLVITSYQTDLQPLQPGAQFRLNLSIQNMGNASAKGVTMIIGGGSAGSGSGGTPQPGGVAGGSGEFSNFAPVGSSNVQSLGDIPSGGSLSAGQQLIVNVSTSPGAYPLKITLSYTDEKNNIINDDQVITLLVYQLPVVELSFYQPVFNLMTGVPSPLPIQLTNLGKKAAVLGSMKITANNGFVENDFTLVGNIEAGGFFTFDATLTPDTPGTLELTVSIDYTDDFNQARTIVKTLQLEVMEMAPEPTPDSDMFNGDDFPMPGAQETFWQKAWRFILGLFGLDSGVPQLQPVEPSPEEFMPMPGGVLQGG